ncbi:hypothetical protein P9D34_15885 [Bacillus swezeyi]|nr:hypothetical protein [Bacillus swezeyi]MEC1261892.1 hypothetical protein [Bacillus swezeyi]MED1741316.1 hypothetical protein [Bacillus swezeyi]MED2944505.1 hypothetical protein [Bacillus swezeyi]MED2966192.1 hypothetical protein [Bacillus swezeyi]MED2976817.1 hypothetical protein [Bacillus swezeyi]
MWIMTVLLLVLIGFTGNMIALLRTLVKQNDRIIGLLEEESNKKR